MANYFVNGRTGADTNNGSSWATAWRTVDKAFANGHENIIWIAPGHYVLRDVENQTLTGAKLVCFVGVGGVVLSALDDSCALGLRHYTNLSFHNMVIKSRALRTVAPSFLGSLTFCNCDVHDGALSLSSQTFSVAINVHMCNLEGALPAALIGNTNPDAEGVYSTDQGLISCDGFRYNLKALNGQTTVDSWGLYAHNAKIVGGCARNSQGFLDRTVASVLGASALMPWSVQSNVLGSTFAAPETLPVGLITRNLMGPAVAPWIGGLDDEAKALNYWVYDPTGPTGTLTFQPEAITLATGESARCLSPVYFFPLGISLSRLNVVAQEYAYGGFAQVVDATPSDTARTLEVRVSDTPFLQTDTLPSYWRVVNRNEDVATPIVGYYIQYRITFNLLAAA